MNNLKHLVKYLYAIITVLIIWFILHLALDSFVVPNPIDVIERLSQIAIPKISKHLLASLYRLLIALSITTIIGYSLGLLIGMSKKIDSVLSPIIYLFFPVPRIAFLPVFMILFGLGDTSKIILIVAIAVFQIIISTRDGVKEIPKDVFLSAKSLKLSKKEILKHVIIPATLPKFFTSLRIVLGSSMAALFFAENYATKFGIGYFIMNAWVKVDYVEMYAGIISISFFGIILFKIIDLFEKRICKWKNL